MATWGRPIAVTDLAYLLHSKQLHVGVPSSGLHRGALSMFDAVALQRMVADPD